MTQGSVDDWYTAGEAAKKMSAHSNRTVRPEYLRTLARIGKVRTKKIGERVTLYFKTDVDAYVVEDRGEKVARIQKARSTKAKKKEDTTAA